MSGRLLIVILAGALAAACSHTETRTVVVPAPTEDACVVYGYQTGTQAYAICVEREAAARRRGRMAAGYAEAQMMLDSQERVIFVFALDIADNAVQSIRSVINPDKLRHLGPLSDLAQQPGTRGTSVEKQMSQ